MDNNSQNCSARGEVLLKYFYDYNEKQEKLDIVKLAGFFGFVVREDDSLDCIHAKMIISGSKNIIVNKKLQEEYKRYAITYELSYYFLYYRGGKNIFKHINELYEDMKVKELAISLLIRDEEFNKYYNLLKEEIDHSQVIETLKEQFCIPKELICEKIQKIDSKQARHVKTKIYSL